MSALSACEFAIVSKELGSGCQRSPYNLLARQRPPRLENRVFLIKAAHLPHEPVGVGVHPLFPPLLLPLPRLPSVTRGGGWVSVDRLQDTLFSIIGGSCCNARDGTVLT